MKVVRTLLGFGVVAASVGVGAIVRNRRRAGLHTAREADVRFDSQFGTSVPANENLVDVAKHSGIADVDPQPMTQIAGEGIDPDADVRAQESVKEQRDRLPT